MMRPSGTKSSPDSPQRSEVTLGSAWALVPTYSLLAELQPARMETLPTPRADTRRWAEPIMHSVYASNREPLRPGFAPARSHAAFPSENLPQIGE